VLTGVADDKLATSTQTVDLAAPIPVENLVPQAERWRVRHDRIIRRWSDICGRPGGQAGTAARPVGVRRIGHLVSVGSGETVTAPM
jgi:hypothetical protein